MIRSNKTTHAAGQPPDESGLRALLLSARPAAHPLPSRFRGSVWRRIRKQEAGLLAASSLAGWLESCAERLLAPRLALAGLALLVVAGGLTGYFSSADMAKRHAQERYLAAVAPSITH